MEKYAKILDETTQNMKKSIINHLQRENESTRPVSRARVSRKHGEVVTEEDVIKRMEEEEELKAQKSEILRIKN